jgi:hypothetical protein
MKKIGLDPEKIISRKLKKDKLNENNVYYLMMKMINRIAKKLNLENLERKDKEKKTMMIMKKQKKTTKWS